jgi:hypothetical protein
MNEERSIVPEVDHPTTGYMTLQFAMGGLFDAEPVGHAIHLVRSTAHGTPGPTLCLLPRFDKNTPGWSVGGGISDSDAYACPSCDAARDRTLPVGGSLFSRLYPSGSDEPGASA